MTSRNNFMLTLVRNLGKHGENFLNDTILKEKDFREDFTYFAGPLPLKVGKFWKTHPNIFTKYFL